MLKKGKKRRRDNSSEFDDKEKKGREEPERVDKLTRKLLQLNVKDDVYAAAYVQLFILVPIMTKIPPSTCFTASTIVSTNTTAIPSYPRYSSM